MGVSKKLLTPTRRRRRGRKVNQKRVTNSKELRKLRAILPDPVAREHFCPRRAILSWRCCALRRRRGKDKGRACRRARCRRRGDEACALDRARRTQGQPRYPEENRRRGSIAQIASQNALFIELPAAAMPKNILIFSDGTGQAGGISLDERRSNIYKLYRATRSRSRFHHQPRRAGRLLRRRPWFAAPERWVISDAASATLTIF